MNPESKTYKLGRAFSPRSTGVAGIFLIIGLGVLAFNHPITWAIGSFFILLFSFVAFTQKRLYWLNRQKLGCNLLNTLLSLTLKQLKGYE
jgi:hypothetical protein